MYLHNAVKNTEQKSVFNVTPSSLLIRSTDDQFLISLHLFDITVKYIFAYEEGQGIKKLLGNWIQIDEIC